MQYIIFKSKIPEEFEHGFCNHYIDFIMIQIFIEKEGYKIGTGMLCL